MKKMISTNLEINLVLEYDIDNDELSLVSSDTKLKSASIIKKKISIEHQISETQYKFGILTLGAKNEIGKVLPLSTEIKIIVNGEYYKNKTIISHKSVRGRIDGLTDMYNCNPELKVGSSVYIIYDPDTKELMINTK